ncbi:MAG: hypothetical protein HZC36_14665 [Armatimonadetes bacterium]|nr:hypothetical protein [Armatimonadota bacterium]
MWIFLNDAFLSVVEHRDDASKLLVRARRETDILRCFPDSTPIRMENADYRWRITVDRSAMKQAMAEAIGRITYPNFKNSIQDPKRQELAKRVWGVMRELEE